MTIERFCYVSFFVLLLATALLQINHFINADSAWLLVVAERIYDGEVLYVDIAETNPPLIVWLNLIPVCLAQAVNISTHHATIICVLFVTLASFLLCMRVNKTYPLITLGFFLPLTLFAEQFFAQREQLFILFALPYLFSVIPGNRRSKGAALLASVGFALKPYFVVFFIACVTFDCLQHKNWRIAFNPIHWLAALPVCPYAFYLLFINTTYLTDIVYPLMTVYESFSTELSDMIGGHANIIIMALFAYYTWLFASRILKFLPNEPTIHYIFALFIAALLTVIIQQKGWSNHWHLFYTFTVGLNVALANILFSKRHEPGFTLLFASPAIVVVLFLYLLGESQYRAYHKDEDHAKATTAVLSHYQGQSILAFTSDLGAVFPAIYQSGMRYEGTYGHLWFLLAHYLDHLDTDTFEALYRSPAEMSPQERKWFDEMVQEFIRVNPKVVIVTDRDDYYNKYHGIMEFDFLTYYNQSPYFARSWQHYKKLKHIGLNDIYVRD